MGAVVTWWATLVWYTAGGMRIKSSRRTMWHLRWTIAFMKIRHPSWRLEVVQPCYSDPKIFRLSAGTHNGDSVFDVIIHGADWLKAQGFLRACGWAAWWRHTGTWASRDAWHIHMISIPTGLSNAPTEDEIARRWRALGIKVGDLVPAQVRDFYRHALGLKGAHEYHGDHTWFPADINKTVFLQSVRTARFKSKYYERNDAA